MLTALIFCIMTIVSALIMDQFVIHSLEKIDYIVQIDGGKWMTKSQEILRIGDVTEAIIISIFLVIAGIYISQKVNQNKLLNAGIAGAAVIILFDIAYIVTRAYVRFNMNKFYSHPRPLFNWGLILQSSSNIPLGFLVAIIGAFLYIHYQKHHNILKLFSIRGKRSQASLDFIMTYGWSIMMVLVAIGVLAYFGVLSPDKFVPSTCTFPSGIGCMDFLAVDEFGPGYGYVAVSIKNSLGYDITNVRMSASDCRDNSDTLSLIKNGATDGTFSATYCFITAGQKYNGQVNITFTNAETGITHNFQGRVSTKVSGHIG